MNIRHANKYDLVAISKIYLKCFENERNQLLWITSSFNSFPRSVYYVVEQQGHIAGYILWCVKNGFRDATIIELEQVAIDPQYSGVGLGRRLITDSFERFKKHVTDIGHRVGAVMVTTTEGNYAENLYKSTLKVSRAAVLPGYASGDEVILYNNTIDA
ncbi:MAG: ribosomal protein S18 acetylase RimI-like enzyme [Methylophilaceae bacterium]|jgi:ribosomal protein S18 acetylase RimI-like enzyme